MSTVLYFCSAISRLKVFLQTLQLNEYDTDPYILQLNHHTPSFDVTLFQYVWRFTQIWKKFAAFARKIVFVIVSEQFYYRNNSLSHLFWRLISTLLKTITNSCFQALEGLKFQALEGLKFQNKQTSKQMTQAIVTLVSLLRIFKKQTLARKRF